MEPSPAKSKNLPVANIESPLQPDSARPEPRVMTRQKDAPVQLAMLDPRQPREKAEQQKAKPGVVQKVVTQKERSRLSAEISQFWDEYQKRPRRKFLSARTKEYKYATYMEAWRAKVESSVAAEPTASDADPRPTGG